MAKKQKHEDHTNHEAWAIPYGDMVTLLLAFFVVMYSISSVNEGKYRVLSDALSQAFGGPPKSIKPVQFGNHKQSGSDSDQKLNILQQSSTDQAVAGDMHELHSAVVMPGPKLALAQQQSSASGATGYAAAKSREALQHMADAVEKAMGPLIDRNMIVVRKSELKLEIEIRTDILFASGAAAIGDKAQVILARLADILKPFPNALRIEGHTDDVPIHTNTFASNWELSAARAASVVHLFMEQGVDPRRMSVEGFGEYRPATANDSVEGRNRNRRVVLVVLADPGEPLPVGSAAPAPQASPSDPQPQSPATAAPDPAVTAPAAAAASESASTSSAGSANEH